MKKVRVDILRRTLADLWWVMEHGEPVAQGKVLQKTYHTDFFSARELE